MTQMTAQEHRDAAAQNRANAQASYERSDTDGFVSQWASGITARKHDLAAQIAEDGGKATFPALFDLEGNLVPAKLIKTRYGMAWGLLSSDDPRSTITGWVNAHPKRQSTIEKKGYREGTVFAPAMADIKGEGRGLAGAMSCYVTAVRLDGGFSRDVEVIDNGCGA